MSNQRYLSPAEREDDLGVWEGPEDVDSRIRDLPAAFSLTERDLGLPRGTETLIRQFKNPENKTQAREAKAYLEKAQLVLLNLMLRSSGYRGTPVTVPVKQWEYAWLVGDTSYPKNFGNTHQQSRQSDDHRFTEAVSPGEGWTYRMLDFKDNFLVVLKSLRYFNPVKRNSPEAEEARNLPHAVWARKMIAEIMGEMLVPEDKQETTEQATTEV
jgi:hypothetical protein